MTWFFCVKCKKFLSYQWTFVDHENKCGIIVQNENKIVIKCPNSKFGKYLTIYGLLK